MVSLINDNSLIASVSGLRIDSYIFVGCVKCWEKSGVCGVYYFYDFRTGSKCRILEKSGKSDMAEMSTIVTVWKGPLLTDRNAKCKVCMLCN